MEKRTKEVRVQGREERDEELEGIGFLQESRFEGGRPSRKEED